MSKLTKGYGSGGIQAILGDIKTYFEGELAKKANTSDIPVITDKADKVTNATSGHLAGLDSNGNLTDSGVSPTEDVTVEGNPVTFESPFEQDAKSVVVSVKPIQSGSGTPSPDNIRPISGIDEVEIGVSGRNIWNERIELGSINNNGENVPSSNELRSTDYIRVKPNTDYYFYEGFSPAYHDVYFYDENKSFISRDPSDVTAFTTPLNAHFMRFRLNSSYGITYRNDICINVSDASFNGHYEPYKGAPTTTTIPLPSTLYGGTVDVTGGSGDSTHGFVQTTWGDMTNPQDRGDYTIKNIPNLNCKSTGDAVGNLCNLTDNEVANFDQNVHYWCQENVGALVSLPTDTPNDTIIQICYELATPTTISFTPTDVELLEGTNVVSTNAEKVAVTYKAGILATLGDIDDLNDKVKTKLDKKDVAKVEGANASKAYAVGDYMLRSDGFYRVTANIASGAAITSNNTTKVTVGGELANKVNNDDSRLSDARTPSNNSLLLHTSGNEGYISGTKYFMNGNIAMAVDQFSASNTYEVGSYTVYQGQLYKCTVRHFESAWDSSHFTISYNTIVANGTIAAGTYETIGSDYAENFEALENCPVCRFVTLDGEKIRLAQPNDYILGITSESPSVIGDSMKQGISVGLLGKLWVEHDGSAEINGYVISGENGIAIKSDKGYRVMAVNGNKCKVLVK